MVQTKALYNLLRIKAQEDGSVKAEPWALENLRTLESTELYQRLAKRGIHLDRTAFFKFADEVDSPEELVELLIDDEGDPKTADQVYLLLFELWRRMIPERPSLSIFCDDLDHQIELYDNDLLESDETIQDKLSNLVELLEEHTDAGMDPKKAFAAVSDYCAHDLESFLYDYIADLLDQENTFYASELLEQFEPFVGATVWFDLLRARLSPNLSEANRLIKALIGKHHNLDFLLEVLRFLISSGEKEPFKMTVQKILPLLETEDEFRDVLDMVADYYRRLDCDSLEQAVLQMKKEKRVDPKKLLNLIQSH